MKKSSVFCLLIFISSITQAQSNFELDILRIGYSTTEDYAGISIGGGARIHLAQNISMGVTIQHQKLNPSTNIADVGPERVVSGLVNMDLYSSEANKNRGFIGLGFGIYQHHVNTSSPFFVGEDLTRLSPGVAPRVGYTYRNIRLTLDHNFTFKEFAPNYWNISVGYTLKL